MVSKPEVSDLFGIAHFYDLVVVKVREIEKKGSVEEFLWIELPIGNRDTFCVGCLFTSLQKVRCGGENVESILGFPQSFRGSVLTYCC